MADQLKEIYAGTLTVADIAATGSVTLATTNANTQYVIKDVSVDGTFMPSSLPTLQNNGFDVASLVRSAYGSEIMDINSTLKYKAYATAPVLTQTALKLVSGMAGAFIYQDLLTYNINAETSRYAGSSTNIGVDLISASSGQTLSYATATDGSLFYVYWDGNSVSRLYKRVGGPNGSDGVVIDLSYGWIVFDGVATYYWMSNSAGSTLYKYNINTAVTTAVPMGVVLAAASYPSAYMMNDGKILVNTTGNSDSAILWIIDPVANTKTQVNGLPDYPLSSNYRISGYYNATTGKYTLYKRQGMGLLKVTLSAAVTMGTAYSGANSYAIYSLPSNYSNCTYVQVTSTSYALGLHQVNGKTDLFVLDTTTSTTSTVAFIPYRTQSDTIIKNTTTSAVPSDFTATVKVRVAGIKSTI